MKKFEYLIAAVKRRENASLKWLLSILAYNEEANPPAWHPRYDKKRVTVADENGEIILDEPIKEYSPLFAIDDQFKVKKGDLANVERELTTTVGIFIINANILVDRLGDAIPYQNGVLSDAQESKLIAKALADGKITRQAADLCLRNRHWLTGILQTVLPSATRKALVPDPSIAEYKRKRLKEDPSIVTDITKAVELEAELIARDKEAIKGDRSELFYKSGKAFNVTRKRMFHSYGIEKEPGGQGMRLLTGSLQEGTSIKDEPYIFNSARDGSHSRGAETQLGGEIVKFLSRIFEKTKIAEDDCGSTVGLEVLIDNISIPNLVGRFFIKNGKVTELSKEELEKNRGKVIKLRSPFSCNTSNGDYCKVCMGTSISHSEKGLSVLALEVGSTFVSLFLAKMHGTAYSLAEYDYTTHIR